MRAGKLARIQQWRELAAERGLSIRDLVIEVTPQHSAFVGTPGQVADEWTRYVRDRLVPELQERGVYRTSYEGMTLREHLDLA